MKLPSVANLDAFGAEATAGAGFSAMLEPGCDCTGGAFLPAVAIVVAVVAVCGTVSCGGGCTDTLLVTCALGTVVTRKLPSVANLEGFGGGADTTEGVLIFCAGCGDAVKVLPTLTPVLEA